MSDYTIKIGDQDRVELERIIVDGDRDAYFLFLKKKVLKQIQNQEKKGLTSGLDGGQTLGGFKGPH